MIIITLRSYTDYAACVRKQHVYIQKVYNYTTAEMWLQIKK